MFTSLEDHGGQRTERCHTDNAVRLAVPSGSTNSATDYNGNTMSLAIIHYYIHIKLKLIHFHKLIDNNITDKMQL